MHPFRRSLVSAAALCAALLAAAPARADGLFDRPVGADRLAAVRGGFSTADGSLAVSFGIRRTVLVDGTPVAASSDATSLLLLQRGPNNAFSVVMGSAAVGTVIQNSLDNQKLQVVTTLDVTANSLQAFRGAMLQSQIRSSLADSVRH